MKPGNLQNGLGILHDALKKLQAAWDDVELHWQDPVSERFSQETLEPMIQRTMAAMRAVQQMNDVVQQAQRECGDPSES